MERLKVISFNDYLISEAYKGSISENDVTVDMRFFFFFFSLKNFVFSEIITKCQITAFNNLIQFKIINFKNNS